MQSLSLLTAVDRDAEETQEAENITGDLPAVGARDAYLSPSFKIK